VRTNEFESRPCQFRTRCRASRRQNIALITLIALAATSKSSPRQAMGASIAGCPNRGAALQEHLQKQPPRRAGLVLRAAPEAANVTKMAAARPESAACG